MLKLNKFADDNLETKDGEVTLEKTLAELLTVTLKIVVIVPPEALTLSTVILYVPGVYPVALNQKEAVEFAGIIPVDQLAQL